MAATPRILFAPLDWGLGHATRCVPIIEEVMQQGGTPVLGTAGRAYAYLKKGWPSFQMKWYMNFYKWIRIQPNNDYHLTKYKFFDENDDEIRLN